MDKYPDILESIAETKHSLSTEMIAITAPENRDYAEPDTNHKIVKPMWIHRFHR
ncbi:MAG: hypothetical protein OQK24_13120 [Magnetovibrio sp.]|nr:hypothetical protein [Magnetovibrio sp.]